MDYRFWQHFLLTDKLAPSRKLEIVIPNDIKMEESIPMITHHLGDKCSLRIFQTAVKFWSFLLETSSALIKFSSTIEFSLLAAVSRNDKSCCSCHEFEKTITVFRSFGVFFVLALRKLFNHQIVVNSFGRHQMIVRAFFRNFSIIHNDDSISFTHSWKPMGNNHRRTMSPNLKFNKRTHFTNQSFLLN